ncbi:MAG: phosphoglucosamine mutase [Aridibacter sp.]
MKKLFGTDGIRGEAGKFPLDEKTIEIIGSSLAKQVCKETGKAANFVIGRDTRESGEWIEKAFCKGITREKANCVSAGIITTPGIAYLTNAENFDAGIVISASHNPFEDNGIKIFSPTGKKISRETEEQIEKDIRNSGQWSVVSGQSVDISKVSEYQQKYLEHLANEFDGLSLSGLKIVVDCANGAASKLAPELFKNFGAEVVTIFDQPNGRNINKDCGSLHLDKLQAKVIEENADFGVAFDGDADRSLFVDEKGNLVDGDGTLWIMAQYLHNEGNLNNDTVVATVMSNLGLEVALNSKNIKLLRTAVGDKYVLQELLNTNSSIGGEQSGHIIFPKRSLVGDGMQTALYLLEALQENNKTLSEMRNGFTQFPQILVNVHVKEKHPFEEVAEIMKAALETKKELGETGRLLLRYSGTENLARVMIEGENQTEIETQAQRLADVIEKSLG